MRHALLRSAAGVLQQVFRGSDVVARVGGDEFAVVLPESDKTVVQNACQRIGRRLSGTTWTIPNCLSACRLVLWSPTRMQRAWATCSGRPTTAPYTERIKSERRRPKKERTG
ncbi:MAG: diguanylate cyclase [Bacillota bacterium]